MSEFNTFSEWAAMFRVWCSLEDGPDAASVTVDGVTLHVTEGRSVLATSAGVIDLDEVERWGLTPESVAMVPSSSKELQITEGLTND